MEQKNKIFSIDVALTEKQAAYLDSQVSTGDSTARKLSGIATGALQDLADGGMMLSPDAMKQVHGIMGAADQEAIVSGLETAKSMDKGRMVGKWFVDPTYAPAIEEMAQSQGLSVSEVIQNAMDYAASQGWLYSLPADTATVFFSREQFSLLRNLLDRVHITGQDIAEYVRALTTPAPKPTPREPALAGKEKK